MVRMPGTWLKQHSGHHNNHYSHGQMGHSIFFVGGPPCHKCHHSQFKCDDFFRNASESWNISIHLSNAHCSSFHHLLMVKDLQPDHFQGIFLDSIISNQDCILFFWKYPPKPPTTETDLAKLWKQGLMMLSEFSAKAFHPWDSMKSLWLTITTIWFLAFSTTLGNLPKLSVISYQEAFLKHPTHHLKWTKINLRLLRQICGLCKKW